MKNWLIALGIVFATPAFASPQEALVEQMERSGANETEEFRHEVDVQNCVMTTYRWKDLPEFGWTLWSSFKFDMRYVSFANDLSGETQAFVTVPAQKNSDAIDLALVLFKLTDAKTASHEFSVHRPMTQESEWSPRGDGKSFRVKYLNNFFYSHEGPGVLQKAEDFTSAFKQYVREYCIQLG